VPGEVVDELHARGDFELGEPLDAPGEQLLRLEGGVGPEHDERGDDRVVHVVGNANDGRLVHGRVLVDDPLDLDGGDVLPSALDDVLAAVDELEIAAVERAHLITGVHPAVPERGLRGRRVIEVAQHQRAAGLAADEQLTGFTG
jgi:hypothetical protein